MAPSDLTEIRDRIADVEKDVAVLGERLDQHGRRSEERHAELVEVLKELRADIDRKRDVTDPGAAPRLSRSTVQRLGEAIGAAIVGGLLAAAGQHLGTQTDAPTPAPTVQVAPAAPPPAVAP